MCSHVAKSIHACDLVNACFDSVQCRIQCRVQNGGACRWRKVRDGAFAVADVQVRVAANSDGQQKREGGNGGNGGDAAANVVVVAAATDGGVIHKGI